MFARGAFSSHFEPFKSCTECHRHNELNRRVAKKLLLGFYVPQKPAGGEHNNMRLEGFIRLITVEQCITILENKPRKPKESLTRADNSGEKPQARNRTEICANYRAGPERRCWLKAAFCKRNVKYTLWESS